MLPSITRHALGIAVGTGLAVASAGAATAGSLVPASIGTQSSIEPALLFKTVQLCTLGRCVGSPPSPGLRQFDGGGRADESGRLDRLRRGENRGQRFSDNHDRFRGDDDRRRRRFDEDRSRGDEEGGRRFSYDSDRYGPRYRDYRSGYRYRHDGWYYSEPFWLEGALLGGTFGSALAVPPPARSGYSDHVAYCQSRYRSYDPASDTFVATTGVRKRCVS